jgi:hypothetical protein
MGLCGGCPSSASSVCLDYSLWTIVFGDFCQTANLHSIKAIAEYYVAVEKILLLHVLCHF